MAAISLTQVHKTFGKTSVIHGVDCAIDDGEFIVIVGPSGCGKSTLLRMIAGLETVSSGDISIGERVVNQLEPAERDIAMVFQNYALYPHMTVYNNMAYGLRNRGMDQNEIDQRVQKAASMLELSTLLARKPRQLSGGQRQRVAMGRAVVREPSAFLFDEPLSNLDAKLRVQMRIELKKRHELLKITSIYVTHDQVEAMTLGERLLVMNGGKVEQIGRPLELYQRPQTAFVASFIGSPSMNLLAATVGDDGHTLALAGDQQLSSADCGFQGQPGQVITVGIRPEHFQLTDTTTSTTTGSVQLHVDLIEELGADTLVHGHFGTAALQSSGDNQTKTPLTVRLPGVLETRIGDALALTVDPQQLHLFAADSGQRLN